MSKFRLSIGALSACALVFASSVGAQAKARRHGRNLGEPVLVELYTAQGCATCPKANGAVSDLSAKKGVLALTFSVDYWDYLGWEDTLAKSEFTARQRDYAQRLRVREIYTPEIVVDGAAESPALEEAKIQALIANAEHAKRRGPRMKLLHHETRVQIAGAGVAGDVWLVRYDPKPASVKIKAGENKGQTVVVRNAVHELSRLGAWHGAPKVFAIPKAEDTGLKTVLIVQAPKGGRILAVAKG